LGWAWKPREDNIIPENLEVEIHGASVGWKGKEKVSVSS